MIQREAGLTEIYNRIKDNRTIIGVKSFKRTPTNPISESDMPCIFMLEGIDNIITPSTRNATGYPARRILEVIFELVTTEKTDIKTMYRAMRAAVFTQRGSDPVTFNPRLDENVFIGENRTEGPIGYGLPDILAMRLILDLVYTDNNL